MGKYCIDVPREIWTAIDLGEQTSVQVPLSQTLSNELKAPMGIDLVVGIAGQPEGKKITFPYSRHLYQQISGQVMVKLELKNRQYNLF